MEKKSLLLMVTDKRDDNTLFDWFEASLDYLIVKIRKYCIIKGIDPKEGYVSDLPLTKKALRNIEWSD